MSGTLKKCSMGGKMDLMIFDLIILKINIVFKIKKWFFYLLGI